MDEVYIPFIYSHLVSTFPPSQGKCYYAGKHCDFIPWDLDKESPNIKKVSGLKYYEVKNVNE